MQVFVNFGDPALMTYIDVPSPTLWNHALFTQKDAYSSIVKVATPQCYEYLDKMKLDI